MLAQVRAIGKRMGKPSAVDRGCQKDYSLFLLLSLFGFLLGFPCPAGTTIPPTLWAAVVAELRSWGLFWETQIPGSCS